MIKQNNKITFDLERASSGNIEKKFYGGSTGGYYIGIDWKVNSQSVSSNSSSVTATFYIKSSGSGYTISSSASKSVKLTIDGSSYSGTATVGLGTNQKKNLISKTVTVKHNSDGSKTCSFACSANIALTLGGTKYNTVSHSGSGSFNKINLNTAPTWSTDDTRIKWDGKEIKANAIIPENVSTIEVISAKATDKEQGSSLNYEIHRYINNSYSAKIKSASSGLTANDNLSSWGQGTKFKYESKVSDGQVQASSTRWSWEYTKNVFTGATFSTADTINNSSTSFNIVLKSAKNSGGGSTYVNNNYQYKIESLTQGVNIYGNASISKTSISDVTYNFGIQKGDSSVSNQCYLKYEEIKEYLKSNNYTGNLKMRVTSSNSYGSKKSVEFSVKVDFRIAPPYAQVSYNENNKINFKGTDYYIPSVLPFKISWNDVKDPIGNKSCTYEVLYQIGDAAWVSLGKTSSTSYTANLTSAIGNKKVEQFSIIIKAITTYGYESNARGPIITLWDYNPPEVSVSNTSRGSDNVTIAGSIKLRTSIPNVAPVNSTWKWINGLTGNGTFTTSGSGNTRSFNFSVNIAKTITGVMTLSTSDEVRELLVKIGSVNLGSTNITVKGFMPILSLTKKGLGVNSRPVEGFKLSVEGNSVFLGSICSKYTTDSSTSTTNVILTNSSTNEALVGITQDNSQSLKNYIRIGANKLQYITNSNTYNIYHSGNKPTASDVGAASSSHNHDNTYLKLSGGTMTGPLFCYPPKSSGSSIRAITNNDNNRIGDGDTHIGNWSSTDNKIYHYIRGAGTTNIDTLGGVNITQGRLKCSKEIYSTGIIQIGDFEEKWKCVSVKRLTGSQKYEGKYGVSYDTGFKLSSSSGTITAYGATIECYNNNNSTAARRYLFGQNAFIPLTDNNTYLGSSSHRWQSAYCTEGKFYTSTKSFKTNINYIDDKANMFSSEQPKSIKDYIVEAIKDTPLAVYNYKTRMMNNPNSEDVTENPMFVGFIADDLAVKHPEFFDLIGEKGEHERPILNEKGEKTDKTVKETQYDISDISMLGVLWAGLQEALLKIDVLEKEIKTIKGEKENV